MKKYYVDFSAKDCEGYILSFDVVKMTTAHVVAGKIAVVYGRYCGSHGQTFDRNVFDTLDDAITFYQKEAAISLIRHQTIVDSLQDEIAAVGALDRSL